MNENDSITDNQKIVQSRALDVLFNNIVMDYRAICTKYQVFVGIKCEEEYLLAVQLSERFKKQQNDVATLGVVLDFQIAMYRNVSKK